MKIRLRYNVYNEIYDKARILFARVYDVSTAPMALTYLARYNKKRLCSLISRMRKRTAARYSRYGYERRSFRYGDDNASRPKRTLETPNCRLLLKHHTCLPVWKRPLIFIHKENDPGVVTALSPSLQHRGTMISPFSITVSIVRVSTGRRRYRLKLRVYRAANRISFVKLRTVSI